MISFKDLVETKNKMQETFNFIDSIKDTLSVNKHINNINRNIMKNVNFLYGKYYSFDKKQIVHSWKSKNAFYYVELQIGKNGIGATPYGGNMKPYECLYNDYRTANFNIKGLFGDVFDNDEIYNKVYEKSSKKGKELLETLKKIKKETNIQPAKIIDMNIKIIPTDYERKIFNIDTNELIFIQLHDGIDEPFDNLTIRAYIHKNEDEPWRRLFEVKYLNSNDEKDYLYCLFMHYHINEFKQLLNDYIEQTKKEKEKWDKFNELFNAEFGKYLILSKL